MIFVVVDPLDRSMIFRGNGEPVIHIQIPEERKSRTAYFYPYLMLFEKEIAGRRKLDLAFPYFLPFWARILRLQSSRAIGISVGAKYRIRRPVRMHVDQAHEEISGRSTRRHVEHGMKRPGRTSRISVRG